MSEILDVAIVGGGVSGTYVAWRLSLLPSDQLHRLLGRSGGKPLIQIFEATPRVGGRLLTVQMPGLHFNAELGGMRYTENHILLRNVIHKCKLTHKDFVFEDRLRYLRGRHLRLGATPTGNCQSCKSPLGFPYYLGGKESSSPVETIKRAIVAALKKARFDMREIPTRTMRQELADLSERLAGMADDGSSLKKSALSGREWTLLKRRGMIDKRYLFELGFWNLLQHFLTSEGFLLVRDALGYESIFANWNAAEAIPWFLADFDVNYLTLKEGLGTVPKRLAAQAESSGDVLANAPRHMLLRIELDQAEEDAIFKLTFKESFGVREVKAKKVVLALPKTALRSIEFGTDQRSVLTRAQLQGFWTDIEESVTAHPLFKMFVEYDRSWWQDNRALGFEAGRTTTDLPIRQVYYYPAQPATQNGQGNRAVVMASYSDEHYVDFWRPLLKERETGAPLPRRNSPQYNGVGLLVRVGRIGTFAAEGPSSDLCLASGPAD